MSANPTPEKVTLVKENRYDKRKIFGTMLIWLCVSVLFSLLPLLIKGLTFISREIPFSLMDIGSRGEFLLIAAALSPVAIMQLISSGRKWIEAKAICYVACLVGLIISCYLYADMSVASISPGHYNLSSVTCWSVWLFAGVVVSGAGCVGLSEANDVSNK